MFLSAICFVESTCFVIIRQVLLLDSDSQAARVHCRTTCIYIWGNQHIRAARIVCTSNPNKMHPVSMQSGHNPLLQHTCISTLSVEAYVRGKNQEQGMRREVIEDCIKKYYTPRHTKQQEREQQGIEPKNPPHKSSVSPPELFLIGPLQANHSGFLCHFHRRMGAFVILRFLVLCCVVLCVVLVLSAADFYAADTPPGPTARGIASCSESAPRDAACRYRLSSSTSTSKCNSALLSSGGTYTGVTEPPLESGMSSCLCTSCIASPSKRA